MAQAKTELTQTKYQHVGVKRTALLGILAFALGGSYYLKAGGCSMDQWSYCEGFCNGQGYFQCTGCATSDNPQQDGWDWTFGCSNPNQ